jgi:hypothetical protein
MNTGTQHETPAFTGIHNQSSTVRSAPEPLAVPSGDIQTGSVTADVLLTHFERSMTMGEALANSLHIAEWCIGDDVLRNYGRTPDEARARLLAAVAAEVWLIDPSGTATKADGTVLHR